MLNNLKIELMQWQAHLLRPRSLFGTKRRVVASTKDQLLGFIFNNCCSFVNSSLHLMLCDDDVFICKIKKIKFPFHAVADKLLAEWLPRELWQL